MKSGRILSCLSYDLLELICVTVTLRLVKDRKRRLTFPAVWYITFVIVEKWSWPLLEGQNMVAYSKDNEENIYLYINDTNVNS